MENIGRQCHGVPAYDIFLVSICGIGIKNPSHLGFFQAFLWRVRGATCMMSQLIRREGFFWRNGAVSQADMNWSCYSRVIPIPLH